MSPLALLSPSALPSPLLNHQSALALPSSSPAIASTISNHQSPFSPSSGVTLVEVMVGLFILVAIIVPFFQMQSTLSNTAKARDLLVAYTILKGETEVMYRTNALPATRRPWRVGDAVYDVVCESSGSPPLVEWKLSVLRSETPLASIHGLLYVAAPLADQAQRGLP